MNRFQELGLNPALLRALGEMGFTAPTPIQAAAIPPALAGRDVLATAATGSGKSAAFGLPLVQSLSDGQRGTTRALILAPTRELALQITEHLQALAKHSRVRVAAIYGGVGFGAQMAAFRTGTDIIVATPGRLEDHLARKTARLENVRTLVLDEADRMLDMGFVAAVRRIVKALPKRQQTLFFSATMPSEIVKLTREILRDPVRVDLQPVAAPAERITQRAYAVDQMRKADLLLHLLEGGKIYSAIAFTRTKHRADRLSAILRAAGVSSERIHGNRSQNQRVQALDGFKNGKYRVLVATDIAARGIDVAELGHVINYDVPYVPEDYVHRVGRTARAERSGEAITFVSREEEPLMAQIERALGARVDRAKRPEFTAVAPVPVPNAPQRRAQVSTQRGGAPKAGRRPAPRRPRG